MTMSREPSTAALESFRHESFLTRRRAPRHPAGEIITKAFNHLSSRTLLFRRLGLQPQRRGPEQMGSVDLGLQPRARSAPEDTLFLRFSSGHGFGHAAKDAQCKTYCHPERSEGSAFRSKPNRTIRKQYGGQTEFPQTHIAIPKEAAMNRNHNNDTNRPPRNARLTLPALLRVILTLLFLLLGVAPALPTFAQTRTQRTVRTYPTNRAHAENLQRWVNAGHDTWCRDPKLVAAHTLEQFAPGLADSTYELASQPVVHKLSHGRTAIYTYYSLDGQTTYRVTLRRPAWLRPTAGSLNKTIWLLTRLEIL
jgi:hypothetical protein